MIELKKRVPCFYQPHGECFNICQNYTATKKSIDAQESMGIDTSGYISYWQCQPLEKQIEREMLGWVNNPNQISSCVIYNGKAEEYIEVIPTKLL
jgi:hypothetical protein